MRYAISFTPPANSYLWQQGSQWLGREALKGQSLPRPRFRDLDPERLVELTRVPAHYGFQATMVPPFRLAAGISEADLLAALADFTARQRPLSLSALEIAELSSFFCLRPVRPSQAVQSLAAFCIREFDRYRAPLTPSELARHRAAMLSGQEKINLAIWGHPHVFEQFRFQFVLTSRIPDGRVKEAFHAALVETFTPLLTNPLVIDALCLCVEPDSGQPMRCLCRFPFSFPSSDPEECINPDQQLLPQDFYPGSHCHPA